MKKNITQNKTITLIPREKRGELTHHRIIFGKSRLGAPLEVFFPEKKDIQCILMAGQHGTEPESAVLLSSVLRSIPQESLECAAITALNPDGLARGTRGNAGGVDLNRNFPAANWSPGPVCHNWNNENPADTALSPGPQPSSEPETTALLSLIGRFRPLLVISIHAPLGCIDDPLMSDIGRWMSGETKLPLVGDIGYETPGSFGSWAKENGLHLITFELPIDSIQNHRRNFTPMLLEILTGGYRRFMK